MPKLTPICRLSPLAFALPLLLFAVSCGKSAPPQETLTTEQRLAMPADPANGERVFRECAVCHEKVKGAKHRVGPTLWGVYGQAAAVHGDFAYSNALRNSGLIWDEATLNLYLENPPKTIPGGRMAFAGESDEANRRDVIAFLKTLQDTSSED